MTTTALLRREVPRDVRRDETARLLAEAAVTNDEKHEIDLLDEVVVLNLGVARSVARRYRDRSVPLEDLEQVAYVALVRAARKFDVAQERDFLAYAVPTISGEVKRYFRDHGWTIRPPRRVQEIQSRVVEANERGHERGQAVSTAEIADELDLNERDVIEALRAEGCFRPASLDAPLTADGSVSWADGLAVDDEGERAALEARLILSPLLEDLGERDRTILRLRFVEDRTQQEIGDELGVTQMQVSRLLSRIIGQLRNAAEAPSEVA